MMTTEEIKKNISKLKLISPDPAFKNSLRALILSQKTEKKRMFFGLPFLKVEGVFAFFALIILIAAALTFELSPRPAISASFNPNYLQNEFETLAINTQIEEVKYRTKTNQTIHSALSEIETTEAKHLNDSLLEDEAENINLTDSTNSVIDKLLEEVTK